MQPAVGAEMRINSCYSIRSLMAIVALVAIALAAYRHFNPPPVYDISTIAAFDYPIVDRGRKSPYQFQISQDLMQQTPTWDRRHEHPPISAQEAMIRADKLRLRMIAEGKPEGGDNWYSLVAAAELRPADREGHWYWVVRFLDFTSGPGFELLIPVLMDGTVVEPSLVTEHGRL